ncbi:sulfur transferase domain-containing protein [Dactylosporangium sp. NPDC051485]|uniref:phosphatase domain-containing putative toxin n=1 Tax=Dactylosporangium sp. NPDC051485 TaxID=3154846 RepID=UPI003446B66F
MLYTVDGISILAKPRPGDWLEDDLARLARAGVQVLVSLLTDDEVRETGLAGEAACARDAGLEFLRVPIPDRQAPGADFSASVLPVLVGHHRAGRHVAVHCRFGIGRSATVAAGVLVACGGDPGDVWARLAAVRGVPVPDVDAQRHWVESLIT